MTTEIKMRASEDVRPKSCGNILFLNTSEELILISGVVCTRFVER